MYKIVSALLLLSLASAAVTPISDDSDTATAFNWTGYWYATNAYNVISGCLPNDPIYITQNTSNGTTGIVVTWTYPASASCTGESLEGVYTSPLITTGANISIPTPDGPYNFVSTTNPDQFTYVTETDDSVLYQRISNTGFDWVGNWSSTDASDILGCTPNNPITITTDDSGLLVSWTFPSGGSCGTDNLTGPYSSPLITPLSAICVPVNGTDAGCYTFISNPNNSNQFTYTNSYGTAHYERGNGASILAPLSLAAVMLLSLFAF